MLQVGLQRRLIVGSPCYRGYFSWHFENRDMGREQTFFLLLRLFTAAPFQLLLQDPLLCNLRRVGSAQGGHEPGVKELG